MTVRGLPILPIGAVLVLVWAYWSRTPWKEIGYSRPKSWIATVIAGLVLGLTFKVLMKAAVMPLLGAEPVNQAYHFLARNQAMLPIAVWAMLVAGFSEETIFRGFLFERLGKLLGTSAPARIGIVLLTSLLFGAIHYSDQALAGAQQATLTGLVFGTAFALSRRIWMVMIAHAAFDLTALAMIHWDIESGVAHLVFGR